MKMADTPVSCRERHAREHFLNDWEWHACNTPAQDYRSPARCSGITHLMAVLWQLSVSQSLYDTEHSIAVRPSTLLIVDGLGVHW